MEQRFTICGWFGRDFKMEELKPPEEVEKAFKKYANGRDKITAKQLKEFLVKEQGEEQEKAESLVKKILGRHDHVEDEDELIDIGGFFSYLFSSDLNSPIIQEVHHDMEATLSHYFIYTGHNSYLTGNQLTSTCSDSPIVGALKSGVKTIELDLWPSKRKVVKVVHGRTMTSPVELNKCLESIKKYAFQTSVYPVILTLEDHLRPEERFHMLKDVFQDMLYVPEPECFKEFPSPDKLKKRILISTKPPQEIDEVVPSKRKQKGWWKRKPLLKESWGGELKDEEDNIVAGELNDDNIEKYFVEDENSDKLSPTDHDCKNLTSPNIPHNGGLMKGSNKNGNYEKSVTNDDYHTRDYEYHDYKSLIAIPNRSRKGGPVRVLTGDPDKVSRLSMSEEVLKKAAQSHTEDLLRFTQGNILRVYPKGSRVDSSNYNPLTGWTRGAQMVAFNMQGYGRKLWLMQGLFRANGGCGYFKKPACLLHSESSNQILNPTAPNMPLKQTLKVKVYMGDGWNLDFNRTYFDCYSPPDFYTKVGIAGVPADTGKMQETSKDKNTWRPVWNKEFIFRLTVPELALLRIEVHEHDIPDKDDFAGQTCLPVSEIRPGIRAVPLYDREGVQYKSVRLLMHFDFL